MPALTTMALFLLAALGLLLIPGPSVLYIITRSVAQGRQAGLASVLGVELASLTHAAAAALEILPARYPARVQPKSQYDSLTFYLNRRMPQSGQARCRHYP